MHSAVFFPSHQSKLGEITAIGHLSPLARTRTRPTFNITRPSSDSEDPIERHLSNLATQFARKWGTALPIYFDFPRYAPDARVADGRHPVEFFFDCARQSRIQGIPVAGPESVRGPGPDYLDAVARIARQDNRGAAIRIPYREFAKSEGLVAVIDKTLAALALKPDSADIFLDFEALVLLSLSERSEEHLFSIASEAIRVIQAKIFRNVIVTGSSIPDQVGKHHNWNPLRIPRTVLKVWQMLAEREMRPPMFGDSGVIYTHDRDGGKSGPPPSRVRLSTDAEYILCRAPRGNYRKLCSQVIRSKDFHGTLRAWGMIELEGCGRGRAGEGNATTWVARDTNLHDESTAGFVEATLQRLGKLDGMTFADPEA